LAGKPIAVIGDKYTFSCAMADGFILVVGKNDYAFLSGGMVWQ